MSNPPPDQLPTAALPPSETRAPGPRHRVPWRRLFTRSAASTVVVALLCCWFVSRGITVATLPEDKLVSWNVIIDDGFYYLQVARNIARGHGSTFDRLNPTNGYQPLWAAALVPIFWFTDNPGTGMRAAIVLSTSLGALAVLLLFLGLRRLAKDGAALLGAAAVVLNPYYGKILQGGLETPMLFVCLALLVFFVAHRGARVLAADARACVSFGLLLGITVLSRVDVALILLPFAAFVWLAPRGTPRAILRRALLIGGGGLAPLAPYLLWGQLCHGSVVPVSGLVKSWAAATYVPTWELFVATEQWRGITRSLQEVNWPFFASEGQAQAAATTLALLLFAALAYLLARLRWSHAARQNRLGLIALSAAVTGVIIHALYMFYIYRSCGHWNYHYFFPFALVWTTVFALACSGILTDLSALILRMLRRRSAVDPARAELIAMLAALVVIAGFVPRALEAARAHLRELDRPPAESFRKARIDGAKFLRESFDSHTVFAAWWAGTVGYFSNRQVVNLDGVINSRAFFETYLKPDRVTEYLQKGPPRYIADFFWQDPLAGPADPSIRHFFWENEKLWITAQLHKDLEVVHMIPFRGPAGFYVLKIRKH